MHKTYLHIALTLVFLLSSMYVAAAARLTVVVVVDGLNEQNLTQMREYWPEGGLRLLSEEAYQTSVTFPHLVYGGDECTATLLTGVTPAEHGITMNTRFVRQDRRIHDVMEDTREKGIGTWQQLSPRALTTVTLSDALRLQYGDKAKIYAIGIHPTTTLLLAGHSANACCWIGTASPRDTELRWVTSSFYKEGLPSQADAMNIDGRFDTWLARQWTPRMDIALYTKPTERESKHAFNYLSSKYMPTVPVANSMVVDLALQIQKDQQLGTDLTPDMLLLELTTETPQSSSDRFQTAEQEDLYLWLNQDLGYLIEQLTRRIGRQYLDILVMGRPLRGISDDEMEQAGLSVQRFNVERAAALCSTYLMALYGHERWVDGGYGQSIYLNRTLIEQKRMSLETMQRQVANFLMELEGIQMAYPAHEAVIDRNLAPSLNKNTTGDVVFTLQSGWRLSYNDNELLDHVIDPTPSAPILYWSGSGKAYPGEPIDALSIRTLLQ